MRNKIVKAIKMVEKMYVLSCSCAWLPCKLRAVVLLGQLVSQLLLAELHHL